MKACTKCGVSKYQTTEFFYKAGVGLTSECKVCALLRFKQRRIDNPDLFKAKDAKARVKHKDKIIAYHAIYHQENSEIISVKRKRYYIENRDEILAVNAKWALANKKKRSLDSKAHYVLHKGLRYIQCSEWKQINKHKVNSYAAKRRGAENNAIPLWFNAIEVEALYLLARQNGEHVDHIVPLISSLVCGLHCTSNLRVISAFENLSKNNRYWPDMP